MRTLRVLDPEDESELAGIAQELLKWSYVATIDGRPRMSACLSGKAQQISRLVGSTLDHKRAEHDANE